MKRMLSAALALLLLLGVLVACQTTNGPSAGSDQAQGTTDRDNAGVTAPEDTRYVPNVPDVTYDGASFHILNSRRAEVTLNYTNDLFVEASDKLDNVEDAMYQRNLYIEETYDITFTEVEDTSPNIRARAFEELQSGDDNYQVMNVVGNVVCHMANDGTLYNLNMLPYLDLEREWWTADSVSSYSLANLLYYVSSDLTMHDDSYTSLLMYNRTVAGDNDCPTPEEMYQRVRDGEWTWEVLFELSKKVGEGGDNGNGELDYDDTYGIVGCDWAYIGMIIAGGERVSVKDENDLLSFNIGATSFVNKFDELVNATQNRRTFCVPYYDLSHLTSDASLFSQNQALFQMQVVEALNAARSTVDDEFGVLPLPKYDVNQESYCSYVNRSTYICVPATCRDPDYVSAILEAWCAKSAEIVVPAYYEVALGEKYLRDEASKDMVEYIFDGAIYDPLVSALGWDTVFPFFQAMVQQRKNNCVTIEAVKGRQVQAIIDAAIDAYLNGAETLE